MCRFYVVGIYDNIQILLNKLQNKYISQRVGKINKTCLSIDCSSWKDVCDDDKKNEIFVIVGFICICYKYQREKKMF